MTTRKRDAYTHGAEPRNSEHLSTPTYPDYTSAMHHFSPSHPPLREPGREGTFAPSGQECGVAQTPLGRELVGDEKNNQDEPSVYTSSTYSQLESASHRHSLKQERNSETSSLPPIDEYNAEIDIAPVDQPPEIQAQQDREPFAILARHLSGVSTATKGEYPGDAGNTPQTFDPPPDGGVKAWLVVMGAWFVLFVQFGISTYLDTTIMSDRNPSTNHLSLTSHIFRPI